MKRLLLIWIFSGSLDSFSQYTEELRQGRNGQHDTIVISPVPFSKAEWVTKPDTLRAIILVTTTPNGIAHSRMGYVVISEGRKPVYLTCDKKALKLPQVGWGWVEAGEGRK